MGLSCTGAGFNQVDALQWAVQKIKGNHQFLLD
jgi:hypothetical protein